MITKRSVDLDGAIARARELADSGGRRILGLVGPPGAGKSTLAAVLAEALGERAVLVPMDGFHLADVQLTRLGRLNRKGAPDTFDVAGYVALLRRLREPVPGTTVYAPAFERELEQPLAGAIAVSPDVPLVITEGNYLLLDTPAWRPVRETVDETWWVESDPTLRHRRLVDRHVHFGKAPDAAAAWVDAVDEANAHLVDGGRDRADLVVQPLPEMS